MAKPSVTLRSVKGSSLTHNEADQNFENLRDATITVASGADSTAIDLNGTITFSAGGQLAVSETNGTITYSGTWLDTVEEDTTPQLGGNLDVQANNIFTSTTNGNISLIPNGDGTVDVQSALDVYDNIVINDDSGTGTVTVASASDTTTIALTINDNVDLPSVELNATDDEIILTSGTITLGGTVDLESNQINNLADPTLAQDAATKAYVDSEVAGASVSSATKTIVEARNASGATIAKGVPVYIAGHSGSKVLIAPADANDASKMPAIGLMDATTTNNTDCDVVAFGTLSGVPTNTFTVGDTLYIDTTPGGATFGGLTTTPPTGETALLQNIGKVARSDASVGQIIVSGPGRSNAVPNLDDDQFFLGNASNQAVATDFSTAVQAISIDYADLSVTTAATGETAALSYNNSTGVFTFTPVATDDLIALDDLSVTTAASAETSALSYNNTTGVFTFTPVETTDLIALDDLAVSTSAVGETSSLTYNNTTGIFTFTPVDTTDLIALDDLVVGAEATASGDGGIAYNNTTGVFTYTPPTASGIGALANVVEDTTPQLGGNLDVNGNTITSGVTNGNVTIDANGNGIVDITSPTKMEEIKQVVETILDNGNSSGTFTVDHSNAIQMFNLTAATTISGFTTPTEGATVTLIVTGGSGTNTLSFSETNSTFYIAGGANPTMTGVDVLTMTCINADTDAEEYLIAHVAVEEIA